MTTWICADCLDGGEELSVCKLGDKPTECELCGAMVSASSMRAIRIPPPPPDGCINVRVPVHFAHPLGVVRVLDDEEPKEPA